MKGPRPRPLRALCDALADLKTVDWDEARHDRPRLASTIDALRELEAVALAHRAIAADLGETPVLSDVPRSATPPNLPSPSPVRSSGADAPDRTAAEPPLYWGHLRLCELVGQGSFGDVYRALDTRLQREVALKVRRLGFGESDAGARRFLDEARSLARIRHPHVLTIHGADVHDRRVGFWTDFIRGRTLAALLESEGPLSPGEAGLIGVALCGALAAVHAAGYVHGDIKAENVMREAGGRIVLMDFGAAHWPEGAGVRSSRPAFGTPLAMAPEIVFGDPADTRADIYGLGVLLFRLVTGRYPVEARNWSELRQAHASGRRLLLRDVRPDVTPAFSAVVERAMARGPEERFATPGEMERALLDDTRRHPPMVEERRDAPRDLRMGRGRSTGPLQRRIPLSRPTALHGRERDLQRLRAVFEQVRQGDGQVILLEGEAGIGKTRLVDEFSETLRARGEEINFLFGSYPPGGAATAAGAFLAAFREFLAARPQAPQETGGSDIGTSPGSAPGKPHPLEVDPEPVAPAARPERNESQEEAGPALWESALEIALAESPRLIAPFSALLAGAAPSPSDPFTMDSFQTAFVQVARALASERPTIILIDDLHFAPADGLGLFTTLALGTPGHRVLLIGATRSGLPENWTAGILRQPHAARLSLERLEEAPAVRLLSEALGSAGLSESQVEALAARCQGNPLFLLAHVHAMRELPVTGQTTNKVAIDARTAGSEAMSASGASAPEDSSPAPPTVVGSTPPSATAAGSTPALATIEDLTAADSSVVDSPAKDAATVRSAAEQTAVKARACGSAAVDSAAVDSAARDSATIDPAAGDSTAIHSAARDSTAQDPTAMDPAARDSTARDPAATGPAAIDSAFRAGDDASSASSRSFSIPDSIQALLRARLAALEEEDRQLLEVASCAGVEFDPSWVAEAAGLDEIRALRRFGLLERRHGLIRAADRRYVFDHHLVMETLYDGLFPRLRERYHGALGETLESRVRADAADPAGLDGSVLVSLAEQYVRGGRVEAARYLGPALVHLERTHRHAAAAELAQRALAIAGLLEGTQRLDVLRAAAARLEYLGRTAEEERILLELLARADAQDAAIEDRASSDEAAADEQLPPEARGERSPGAETGFAMKRAPAIRQQAILERARARRMLGALRLRQARDRESSELLEAALTLARECGDRREESNAIAQLAILYTETDRLEEAEQAYLQALELARQSDYRIQEIKVTGNLGVLVHARGRPGEARDIFQRHLALSRAAGYRLGEAIATGNLGALCAELGDVARARVHQEHHLAIAREIGFRQAEAIATGNLASLDYRLGHLAAALTGNDRMLCLSVEIGFGIGQLSALHALSAGCLALGRLEQAQAWEEREVALAIEMRRPVYHGEALLSLAEVALERGDHGAAKRLCHEAMEVWNALDYDRGRARALVLLGTVERHAGRPAEARKHLEAGLVLARGGQPSGAEPADAGTVVAGAVELAQIAGTTREMLGAAPTGAREMADAALTKAPETPGPALAEARATIDAALTEYVRREPRLTHVEKLRARWGLYQATGEAAHLHEARRLLDDLRQEAPAEDRLSMVERIAAYRGILAAGAADPSEGLPHRAT